jgi:DNA polymerase-3 subunit epsilon
MKTWKDTPIHVLDFEGSTRTGIVEYGVATLHHGEITHTFTRLCATSAPVPGVDTQCHGLRNADLAGAAPAADDWDFFAELRRSGILCAHHAATENGLLKNIWPFPGAMPDHARLAANDLAAPAINEWGPWLDSLRLASVWCPRLPDYSLATLVNRFCLGKKLDALAATVCPPNRRRFHCALYDALAAALLLRHLCELPEKTNASLETLVRDSLCGTRQIERMQTEFDLGL